MAVEPLINLSTIDLDAIVVSADEIGRMNPQAGHMRQLDDICYVNDEKTVAVGRKIIHDDEFWVEGHIPGRSMYPGVLMSGILFTVLKRR